MQRTKQLILQLPPLTIPPQSLQQFPLFPDLPSEIRNKIWGLAAHEPRIIKLFTDTWHWIPQWHPSHHVEGQSHVPALLHVNQEARREGRRYYECCYERTPWHNTMTLPSEEQDHANENTIFINFAVDEFLQEPRAEDAEHQEIATLQLDDYNFDSSVLSRVRHLVVRYKFSATSSEISPDVHKVTSVVALLLTRVLNRDLQDLTVTVAFEYYVAKQWPAWSLDCVDGHLSSSSFEKSFLLACSQWKLFKDVTIKGRWLYNQGLVTDLPPCSAITRLSEFYDPLRGVFGFGF